MSEQFQNPDAVKLKEETVINDSTQKRVNRVAERAAEKSTKAEQHFDKDNSNLFSK
ncbi:MAG: hypothetical protein ABR990_04695 [Terracidiphilus sp.]|jgi:hypothetical protein